MYLYIYICILEGAWTVYTVFLQLFFLKEEIVLQKEFFLCFTTTVMPSGSHATHLFWSLACSDLFLTEFNKYVSSKTYDFFQ